jgi:SPP1 family predicted phage head-tail adaptor
MADVLKAGDLVERVEIQSNTPTVNARGQSVEVWSTVATRWAKVIANTGSESETAGKLIAMRRFDVTLRTYPVTTKMRLKWNGVYMSVNAVLPIGISRAGIRLMCSEVAA